MLRRKIRPINVGPYPVRGETRRNRIHSTLIVPLLSRVFFANFLYKYLYLFRDSIRMVIVFFVFLITNVSIAKRPLTSARFSVSVIRSFQILQGLRLLFCSHFCVYSNKFRMLAWGIGGRWPSILLRASHTCEFVAFF